MTITFDTLMHGTDERPLADCLADLIEQRDETHGRIGALPSSEHGGQLERTLVETARSLDRQIQMVEVVLATV